MRATPRSPLRLRAGCLLLVLLSLNPPLSASEAGAPAGDPAAVAPGETVALFASPDVASFRESVAGTPLGRILAEPEIRDWLAVYRRRIEARLAKAGGDEPLGWAELSALLSRRVTAALALVPARRGTAAALLAELDLPEGTAEAEAEAVRERLPAALSALVPLLSPEAVDVRPAPGTRGRIRVRILLAGDPETPGCDFVPAGTPSLADDPDWRVARAHLGDRPAAVGWVRLAPAWEIIREEAETRSELAWLPELNRALGLEGLRGAAFATRAAEGGFRNTAFLHYPAPLRGVFHALGHEPVSEDFLAFVPGDVRGVSAGRIDPAVLADAAGRALELLRTGSAAAPLLPRLLHRVFGTGLSPDDLSPLGDETAMLLLPEPDRARGALPLADGVLLNRLRDPAAAREALDAFWNRAALTFATGADAHGLSETPHELGPIRTLRLGGVFAPSYAITGDVLVAGARPTAVERVLDTKAGTRPSIADRDAFREASRGLPLGEALQVSFGTAAELRYPGGGLAGATRAFGFAWPLAREVRTGILRARTAARLERIGSALETYSRENGALPPDLPALYDDGTGLLPDPASYRDAVTGTGFHYLAGLPADAPSPAPVVFSAESDEPDAGRLVLRLDGAVHWMPETAFEALLAETRETARADGRPLRVLEPWAPPTPARIPESVWPDFRPGGDGDAESPDRPPEAEETRALLAAWQSMMEAFPFAGLPPLSPINRHLRPSAMTTTVDLNGLTLKGRGPLPFGGGHAFGDATGPAALGTAAAAWAVALPFLRPAAGADAIRLEKAAARRLLRIARAETLYRRAHPRYARSLRELAEAERLPPDLAQAARTGEPLGGYAFRMLTMRGGSPIEAKYFFGVAAVPVGREAGAARTLLIDSSGLLYARDAARGAPRELPVAPSAEGWERYRPGGE
jgi:hypothetical protein